MKGLVSMDALGLLAYYGFTSPVHHVSCRAKRLKLARPRSSRARFFNARIGLSKPGWPAATSSRWGVPEKRNLRDYNIGMQGNRETEAISTPANLPRSKAMGLGVEDCLR